MDMTLPPKLHSVNRSIGAILLEAGRLSAEGAGRILTLQKTENLRFGDAALRLGLLCEDDIRFALSHQYSYAYLPFSDERPISEELIAAYQPFSPLVEQLRSIRTQLLLRVFDEGAENSNVLAIVSPTRGDGRSFLAANLAVVFSQLGERTLLIDADLRRPRQHELFKLGNRDGLSSLLAKRCETDVIVPVAALSNLDVLPAGPVPPNPLELINRPAFGEILDRASRDYQVVLVDTPAVTSGADASMLAVRVGAALAIARNNQTRVGAFGETLNALVHSGVNVVGSIFNDPPLLKS